jgi:hypothetical protein
MIDPLDPLCNFCILFNTKKGTDAPWCVLPHIICCLLHLWFGFVSEFVMVSEQIMNRKS